ncbi:MAG: XRE family transcriptional regulator [Geminicoccaceae bacterium]|nr:MAG: XRE family transcriptional regulator [Geminicoccaceae bacterium]
MMTAEPHFIDRHVGRRLRMRRLLMGMSQERLGELLGLTFQQIQKYERGANRLGASRLFEAARALEVDVGFFFAELDAEPNASVLAPGLAEAAPSAYEPEPLQPSGRRDTLELVRAFERIDDPEVRRRVLDLTKAVAGFETRRRGGS